MPDKGAKIIIVARRIPGQRQTPLLGAYTQIQKAWDAIQQTGNGLTLGIRYDRDQQIRPATYSYLAAQLRKHGECSLYDTTDGQEWPAFRAWRLQANHTPTIQPIEEVDDADDD